MISIGKCSEKQIDEIFLTRYACYLIAQNADARKVEILNLNKDSNHKNGHSGSLRRK